MWCMMQRFEKKKKILNICKIFLLGLPNFLYLWFQHSKIIIVHAKPNNNLASATVNLSKPVFLLPHLARWSLEMSSHSCHIYQIWIGIILKMTPVNCVISTPWPHPQPLHPFFIPPSVLWHHLPFLTPLKVYLKESGLFRGVLEFDGGNLFWMGIFFRSFTSFFFPRCDNLLMPKVMHGNLSSIQDIYAKKHFRTSSIRETKIHFYSRIVLKMTWKVLFS